MPAATVNTLSSDQLSGFSNDQLTSLMNSPNYSQFSSSITSSLSSLSGVVSTKTNAAFNNNFNLILLIGLQTILFLIFKSY